MAERPQHQQHSTRKHNRMLNIIISVGMILICIIVIMSVDTVSSPVAAGIFRLQTGLVWGTQPMDEKPTSPLRNVINWSLDGSKLNPETCQMFDGDWVRIPETSICINSGGFRDYEYQTEKPGDVFRIIMLGDSHTFGWGVELKDTVPKQLERMLNEKAHEKKFEVLNFGIPAHGTIHEIQHLREEGLAYQPDLVIFSFRDDDLVDYTLYKQIEAKVKSASASKRDNESPIEADAVEVFIQLGTLLSEEHMDSLHGRIFPHLENLSELSQTMNFSVLFVVEHPVPPNVREFMEWSLDQLNLTKIDLYIQDHPKYDPFKMNLHPLDSHPTPLANRIRAELILEDLSALLSNAEGN